MDCAERVVTERPASTKLTARKIGMTVVPFRLVSIRQAKFVRYISLRKSKNIH